MSIRKSGVNSELFAQIEASAGPGGVDPEVIEDLLREYFSGKRDAVRTYKFLNIALEGRHGSFQGMAIDISRSGMLVRVMDDDFATAEEMEHLMPYTARVWYHFEGGFSVDFLDKGVSTRGDVVRVTGYCGSGSSLILIGCRFHELLPPKDCEKLGIECADDRPLGS